MVGVGIAPSKTLAKLANFAAKKWRGTGGVVDLSDPARQRKLLALLPVEEVWGVGRRLTRQLQAMGIHTALQLADCDTRLARKTFSVVLERTIRELRGESCLQWEDEAAAKEQIICSRSFGQRLTHYPHARGDLQLRRTRRRKAAAGKALLPQRVGIYQNQPAFGGRRVLQQYGHRPAANPEQ